LHHERGGNGCCRPFCYVRHSKPVRFSLSTHYERNLAGTSRQRRPKLNAPLDARVDGSAGLDVQPSVRDLDRGSVVGPWLGCRAGGSGLRPSSLRDHRCDQPTSHVLALLQHRRVHAQGSFESHRPRSRRSSSRDSGSSWKIRLCEQLQGRTSGSRRRL